MATIEAASVSALSPTSTPQARQTSLDLNERLAHLDVLRGFALFGMLMVHLTYYATGSGRAHDFAEKAISFVFETKFWALFAFLFGVSFAVQMVRANVRSARLVPLFLRRLLGLGLIAVAIKIVFNYNVLLYYATWGVALLLVRNLQRRWILGLLAVCLVAPSAWQLSIGIRTLRREGSVVRADMALRRESRARKREVVAVIKRTDGPMPQAMRARAENIVIMVAHESWWIPSMDVLGLFLLGLLAVRTGLALRPHDHRPTIVRLMVLGAAIFVLSLLIEHYAFTRTYDFGLTSWNSALSNVLYIPEQSFLMFTYAGAVVLWGLRLLAPLGWIGRMALSNYVMQLLFLEGVLSRRGLEWGIPLVWMPVVCVAFIALQIAVSKWWVGRYRFGPVEWLWRSFTYARLQPMRRVAMCEAQPDAVAV